MVQNCIKNVCIFSNSKQPHAWSDLQLRVDNMTRSEWAVHNRTESIKWWIRCFLLGMEHIYVANRDENAFVRTIKRTQIRDLYKDAVSSSV